MTETKFNLINKAQWSHKRKKEKKPLIVNTSLGKTASFVIILLYLLIIVISGKIKNDKRISPRY